VKYLLANFELWGVIITTGSLGGKILRNRPQQPRGPRGFGMCGWDVGFRGDGSWSAKEWHPKGIWNKALGQ